jgi:hypothetical protein
MTTRLESRLRVLEGGTGGKCPRCNFDGDWSKVRFQIEPGYGDGKDKSERCETCGRPMRIVLRWEEKV